MANSGRVASSRGSLCRRGTAASRAHARRLVSFISPPILQAFDRAPPSHAFSARQGQKRDSCRIPFVGSELEIARSLEKLEAPPGIEPGMEVLQTSALPLGDGALRDRCTLSGGLHLYRGSPVVSRPDEQGGRTSPDGGDTGPLTRPARPLAGGAYWNW